MSERINPPESVGYEFHTQERTEDEQPLEVGETLDKFNELVNESERLGIVTDLDGTVVPYEKNPNDCKIDQEAHEALSSMHSNGVGVIAMTGRSGAEGARLLNIPGATIIGTAGWETYKVDENDPSKGESIINEKFHPHADEITSLLYEIRTNFFKEIIEAIGEEVTTQGLTNEIETADGTIVFERKAVSDEFPEGLEIGINLNQYNPEKWDEMIELISHIYENNIDPEIRDMITFSHVKSTIGEMPICGAGVGPHGGEGKDKSLIGILRETELAEGTVEGRLDRPKYDGLVFFGDSNQDAKALRAAHLTAVLAGRRTAGVVVSRENNKGQERALKNADVQTNNIEGNAYLLSRLDEMVSEKVQKLEK